MTGPWQARRILALVMETGGVGAPFSDLYRSWKRERPSGDAPPETPSCISLCCAKNKIVHLYVLPSFTGFCSFFIFNITSCNQYVIVDM